MVREGAMDSSKNMAVIFAAFASDRTGSIGHLSNVPEELRRMRGKLKAAEQICHFESRSDCTADEIFEVLLDTKYRDRIALFHYSGHADSYHLLLETRDGKTIEADASGLASFLAVQNGLQVVFLNGCSTRQQARGLFDANKNLIAVIATSQWIDDGVATEFSEAFYAALAAGQTLRKAFKLASSAINATRGSEPRKLCIDDPKKSVASENRSDDGFPWELHEREGSSEFVDKWSLPSVANDPLFGLPKLDETNLPASPYKHLHWFTRKDAEIFFGRGWQIRELYDTLTSGTQPVVLFYGQSGVGKSSLLDAGVLPYLAKSYEVRYERRGDRGLLATLRGTLGLVDGDNQSILNAWLAIEAEHTKPVIIILDQVEEFYTRPLEGLPGELEELLQAAKSTFGDPVKRPLGKLVLGFREEWLAKLEKQVKVYEIQCTKIFLEPLDRKGIIEAVRGPTLNRRLDEQYGLSIDDGLAGEIADNLLADRRSAVATTLQILLSKMWEKATEFPSVPPKFTRDLYLDLKKDGILLSDFLKQQLKEFAKKMSEPAETGLLLDILAQHTTVLGTADELTREELLALYPHVGDVLPALLQHCQDLHLLTVPRATKKTDTNKTRLAHDTLASHVRLQFETSDRPGQRARRILDAKSAEWRDEQSGATLGIVDLKTVENGATGTRAWNKDESRLVNASRWQRQVLKLIVIMSVFVAGAALCWAYYQTRARAKDAEQFGREQSGLREEAEEKERQANKQLARNEFQAGVRARDIDHDVINAGHRFLQAGVVANKAGEVALAEGYFLASASMTEKVIRTFLCDDPVQKVVVCSDRKRFLTISGRVVRLWSAENDRPLRAWEHKDVVDGASFNNSEDRVLTWSYTGPAHLWSVDSDTPIHTLKHERSVERFLAPHLTSSANGGIFSRDGRQVLTWGGDGSARIWSVETGELLHAWQSDRLVWDAAFNYAEDKVITRHDDATLRLWSVGSERPLRVWDKDFGAFGVVASPVSDCMVTYRSGMAYFWSFKAEKPLREWQHDAKVNGAVFSNAGDRLLTWSDDKYSRLYSIESDEPIDMFPHESGVTGSVFNDAEDKVLTWSYDGTARMWPVENGSNKSRIWQHDSSGQHGVEGAALNALEDRVITWSRDNSVKLWSHKSTYPLRAWHYSSKINGAKFIDDENRVLIWSDDGTVRLWSVKCDEPIRQWAHESDVGGAVFTTDGNHVLSWSNDQTVGLWSVKNDDPIRKWDHNDRVRGAIFNTAQDKVLSWTEDGEVRLLSTKSDRTIRSWQHDLWVYGAKFNAAEDQILSWSHDKTMRLWSIKKEEALRIWDHDLWVAGALFNAAEDRVLSWSAGGTIQLWSVKKDDPLLTWRHSQSSQNVVRGVMFSADEDKVLSWSADGTARLWLTKSGKLLRIWRHDGSYKNGVNGAKFNTAEDRLLTWSIDGTARLWPTDSEKPLRIWRHDGINKNAIQGATFNTAEDRVLTWSDDGTARLWSIESDLAVRTWKHTSKVKGAIFNTDEDRVLTWSDDKTVQLWSIDSNDPLRTWQHEARVSGAAFDSEEDRVLSWTDNGIIRLWKNELDDRIIEGDQQSTFENISGTTLDSSGRSQILRDPQDANSK